MVSRRLLQRREGPRQVVAIRPRFLWSPLRYTEETAGLDGGRWSRLWRCKSGLKTVNSKSRLGIPVIDAVVFQKSRESRKSFCFLREERLE